MDHPSQRAPLVSSIPPPSAPSRRSFWPWLLAALLVVVAIGYGGYWWRLQQTTEVAHASAVDARIDTLTQRLATLRSDQSVQAKRLQQAIATNRILRDELLGLAERSALIEESFARYSDPGRHGAQGLRLDEAEVLLSLGQQRLQIAGDLEGARRSYALAAGVLEAIEDPAYLNLRQTLGQERAALDALGAEPRTLALARLDEWVKALDSPPPAQAIVAPAEQPWWKRAFSGIVEVRQSDQVSTLDPGQRADARAGLQLEITLARAAAERRDTDAYRAALARAGTWLDRLFTDSDTPAPAHGELQEIAAMPLSLPLASLGTTLNQLRQLRADRREPLP